MKLRLWFPILSLLALSGCTGTARLYSLNTPTPQIIHLKFVNPGFGHGTVTGTGPHGEPLDGEFNTLPGGGQVVTTEYGWAASEGFSFSRPNTDYGTVTVAGGGLVIDCVYGVSELSFSDHGEGICRDNKGTKYRLHF